MPALEDLVKIRQWYIIADNFFGWQVLVSYFMSIAMVLIDFIERLLA